jgi:RNA polymerase sigma-70 factor, ECF subfamily
MSTSEYGPLDRTEFEQVVVEYADRLYSIALRITASPPDAEDAVQEAFISAYRHLRQFRGEASPRTWLYRITVNAALARLRDRGPQEYLDDASERAEQAAEWTQRAQDQAVAGELRDELERALGMLAPDLRAAVILRDVEGLSTREAAQVLDIGEPALKTRLHRARVLLRQALADYLNS